MSLSFKCIKSVFCGVTAISQLHVSKDIIKSILLSARESLVDKAVIIEKLYYDLLSDPNIIGLSIIHVHLERVRRIFK